MPYRRILAAVDPAGGAADKVPQNIKILEIAASLAAAGDGELHVVHGWTMQGQDRHTIVSEVRDTTKAEILDRHEAAQRAQVEALLDQANMQEMTPHLHLPRDLPERAIINVSDAEDIDIIVMGSVTRTGIAGFFMGNTAETVLAAVQRGVFAIKPDGFQTPVNLEDYQAASAAA
jgi:nucleotide-binding universal stress UspA family protein